MRSSRTTVIAGVADIVDPSGSLDAPTHVLQARAIQSALADAGMELSDVDGLCSVTGESWGPTVELAEYLGITPKWLNSTNIGGASFELDVEQAMDALAAGRCEVVVVAYAATPRTNLRVRSQPKVVPASPLTTEWEAPYRLRGPMGANALIAARHSAVYGTTTEQRAAIVVSSREWGALTPRARRRETVTVADVLASPVLAAPIHVMECCLVSDGAGAVVLTTRKRAADLRGSGIDVLGAASSASHLGVAQMRDLTVTSAALTGPAAFGASGLTPADVDVAMLYDAFTTTVLLVLEDLGFCAKGEGGAFVENGRLGPGGALPTNTNGGGISYTHPGMYGIFLLVEATRQLRGECENRQVKDARVALVHGIGGALSTGSTLLLGRS